VIPVSWILRDVALNRGQAFRVANDVVVETALPDIDKPELLSGARRYGRLELGNQ